MSPITVQETVHDHVLMIQAYAKNMGAMADLDDAETTINERRGEVVDNNGDIAPDYSRRIRDNISAIFMRENLKTTEDHAAAGQALEEAWWAKLESMGLNRG